MSRQSIQKIKAMLLCIEYGILFVDTVDTKDQSNAYWVLSMVSCLSTVSIQRIKAMLLCFEYGILFVDTVDTKDQSNAIGY